MSKCKPRKQWVKLYAASITDGRLGGQTRTYTEAATLKATVTLQNARDKETGAVIAEQQTATVKVPSQLSVDAHWRAVFGGVEWEVVAVDPLPPEPRRNIYLKRVEDRQVT